MWAISPVTRKPANPKAYNRQKTRKWINDDFHSVSSVFSYRAASCEQRWFSSDFRKTTRKEEIDESLAT